MPTCAITHRDFPNEELTVLSAIRPQIAGLIRRRHPELSGDSLISLDALGQFRAEYVRNVLEEDIGAVTALENEVVHSLQEQEVLSSNVEKTFETKLTFGEQLSDRLAAIGGSWAFIGAFAVLLAVWIVVNTRLDRPPDPYPYILLNLMLSCLAALQAPVIMMSQNRQEAKDRLRAEHDYKVNLKAELEIRHLHEKMDFLLKQQAQRLFELQELQIDLMEELAAHRRGTPPQS